MWVLSDKQVIAVHAGKIQFSTENNACMTEFGKLMLETSRDEGVRVAGPQHKAVAVCTCDALH